MKPFQFLLLAFLLVHAAPAAVLAQLEFAMPTRIAPLDDLLIFQSPASGLWRTDGTSAGTFWLAPTCRVNETCRPILGPAGGKMFFLGEVPELSSYTEVYQLWATDGSREGTHQLTAFPEGLPNWNYYPIFLPAPGLGLLFFAGATQDTGQELWASDGTPTGTRLVADIKRGPEDGLAFLLGEANGWLLFTATTHARGTELYRSDGTTTGTSLLRDFLPGSTSSDPYPLLTFHDQLFFTFAAPALTHELWLTDGTPAGTRLVHAMKPIPPDVFWPFRWWSGSSAESQVFFFVDDIEDPDWPHSDKYIMRSDGTPAGTYPLRHAEYEFFETFADSVLFTSGDAEHGLEPWVSDGSLGGTRLLADLVEGPGSSWPIDVMPAGLLAYFTTRDETGRLVWWVTDGTTAGTRRIFTFTATHMTSPRFQRGPQDRAFFVGSSGRASSPHELWVSPAVGGSIGSTMQLLGPSLEPFQVGGSYYFDGGPLGDLFLFVARDIEHGTTLWRSDGTPEGTFPLVRLVPPSQPDDLPGAVMGLTARPLGRGTGVVELDWLPIEVFDYEIEMSSPGTAGFEPGGTLHTTQSSFRATGLIPGLPYAFRIRAWNEYGQGPWAAAAATPLPATITPCAPGAESLCLHGSRFEVKAFYRDHLHGGGGVAQSAPMEASDDSGTFWFFDDDNLELMVKVLDARAVNGYFWSFFGGPTTLETWITVTDTEAQTNVTFHKGPDNLCGQADVTAFPRPAFEALGGGGSCEPGPNHLCLTNNRYRVEVSWRDQRSGHTGVGHALPGTEDSGFFWFFDDENVELLVKVLDATTVNGHIWVFSGSMTDVEYTLTVTDTLTGQRKQYYNPPGTLCGQADVAAF